jgi:hypothetical protein
MRISFCMLLLAARLQAGVVFTLNPFDGHTTGTAGGAAGFGFTLLNDIGYLVPDQLVFVPNGTALPFTDFLAPQFHAVGGADPFWTQDFDPVAQTGVGLFAVPGTASPSDLFLGELRLYYDVFSVSPDDPAFDPGTDLFSSGNMIPLQVEIGVAGPQAPEPAPGWLIAAGLLLWSVRFLRRSKASTRP